jgi:hypothetical protein
MDSRGQDSCIAKVAPPTTQEIETRKANKTAKKYMTAGSPPVLMSRAVVGGLIIVIWIVLWWKG